MSLYEQEVCKKHICFVRLIAKASNVYEYFVKNTDNLSLNVLITSIGVKLSSLFPHFKAVLYDNKHT